MYNNNSINNRNIIKHNDNNVIININNNHNTINIMNNNDDANVRALLQKLHANFIATKLEQKKSILKAITNQNRTKNLKSQCQRRP